jgi:hypothetical protein
LEDNIKTDFSEKGWEIVNWNVAQDRHHIEISVVQRIKKFLLLKNTNIHDCVQIDLPQYPTLSQFNSVPIFIPYSLRSILILPYHL